MSSTLDSLPPELGRHRILTLKQTCEFTGLANPTWRAKHARGETPPAIKIGKRKLGWRLGDLVDWIAARAEHAQAAPRSRRVGERSRAEASELTT